MKGYINAEGHYIREADQAMPHDISPQFKPWSHDNQRKRMNADVIQPYVNNSKPNPEFVSVYRGDIANRYFTQEQQDKADRDLGGLQ